MERRQAQKTLQAAPAASGFAVFGAEKDGKEQLPGWRHGVMALALWTRSSHHLFSDFREILFPSGFSAVCAKCYEVPNDPAETCKHGGQPRV